MITNCNNRSGGFLGIYFFMCSCRCHNLYRG
jgi:hypothetical protein